MKKPYTVLIAIIAGAALNAIAADVAANWGEHCAKCHGDDGRGDTKQGRKLRIKDLSDAAFQAKFTDEEAFKAIKDGVKDESGKTRMKPAEGLSDDEMRALVPFVRALKK